MPKFLMFDHGGVLDGNFVVSKADITQNDIVLMEYNEGGFQVLKNGVAIVNKMNYLIRNHSYEVVFHSKNREHDQLALLNQLQIACNKIELRFPTVKAMAVYDSSSYKNISSTKPIMTNSQGIIVAGWGADDLDGKISVRRALEAVLGIGEKERGQHVVFDDGDTIIDEAKKEGYQAFMIGQGKGQVTLNEALQQVLLSQPVRESDIESSVVEELCNDFLAIDVKAPATPMKISLDVGKAKPGMVCLSMSFDVSVVGKYLPQLDKLKYILEKLGLSEVEKESTNDWGHLNVPCREIVKLSPLCNWRYSNNNLEEDKDSKLRKVQILCAQYLGHTWEVRQNGSPFSPKDLDDKEQVISQLHHAKNINEARTILSDNHELLSKNRTPWAILILKSLAVILTLPISLPALLIHSSVTRGTCNFFKPDSQILLDNVSMELSQGCK